MRYVKSMCRSISAIVLVFGVYGTSVYGYDYYLTGSSVDVPGNGMLGGLLLAGGSTDVDSAMTWFKSQANGGDVVVLRASGSDGYNDYLYSELGGTAINSVETFVMDSRSESWDSFVLNKINGAEAIFFAGGNQANYYEFWEGTPIEDAVNARAQAGAVIGGTSAGLAIMGSSAHVSLNGGLTSSEALNNPYHQDVTVRHDFLDLALMRGVVTDSHFEQRDREGRLMAMIARSYDETPHQPFRGLGVNERTAVTVTPDGTATVHGTSTSPDRAAFAFETTAAPQVLQPSQPLTLHDIRAIEFNVGDSFDFNTFRAAQGVGDAFSYDVVNGVLLVGPPIDPPEPLLGDLDGDGFVGIEDLNLVLGHWNESIPPADIDADPSGDGFVGIEDLNLVLGNWNAGNSPSASVPEPAALSALFLLVMYRRIRH